MEPKAMAAVGDLECWKGVQLRTRKLTRLLTGWHFNKK